MRPQKHKEKMLHRIQAAGPLPHSHPSPWYPCLQLPWPTHLGCLRRAELSRAGSGCCWHHPTPTPDWGSGCGQGLWPWIAPTWASVPWIPLWSPGEQSRRRGNMACTHSTIEAAGVQSVQREH